MTQPALGLLSSAIVMAIALAFVSAFDFPTFAGWVSFVMLGLIPMQIVTVVLWGANVANNQPVFAKYLFLAKSRGARVVVINPYLEPGLERYWVPSNVESALFGTKLCDLHVPVRPEGDVALANALLQRLVARRAVDDEWIAAHTEGWD